MHNHEPRLKRRDRALDVQTHYDRVVNTKSTMDTWNFKFLEQQILQRSNRRFNRAEAERLLDIRRKNENLVGKITDVIMNSPAQTPYPVTGHSVPHRITSLNIANQKREHERITQENLALAKRIIFSKPTYEAKTMIEFSEQHDRLLSNLQDKDKTTPILPRMLPSALDPERIKSFVSVKAEEENRRRLIKEEREERERERVALLERRMQRHQEQQQRASTAPPADTFPRSAKLPTISSSGGDEKKSSGGTPPRSPNNANRSRNGEKAGNEAEAPAAASATSASPADLALSPCAKACVAASTKAGGVHLCSVASNVCISGKGIALVVSSSCSDGAGWSIENLPDNFVSIKAEGNALLCSSKEGEIYLSTAEPWGAFSSKWIIEPLGTPTVSGEDAKSVSVCSIKSSHGLYLAHVDGNTKVQLVADSQAWLRIARRA